MAAREAPGAPHPRLRTQLFWSLFAVSFVALGLVTLVSAFIVQHSMVALGERDLVQQCDTVASALDAVGDASDAVRSLDVGDARLTLIDEDGTVVYDNRENAAGLENHADRPEVREALTTGRGQVVRQSATELTVVLYGARLLGNGQVVRLSVTREGALAVLADMAPFVCALAVVLAFASAFVARALSRRLTAPLERIDPMHPLEAESVRGACAEVMPLLRRIDEQHGQIERQMEHLADNDRMRVEFTSNVSHELKTPLTVISGYAELIETGIAAPQDVPGFAGRIHGEAQHLTALVNDILTLSRMDEAERSEDEVGIREPVDLSRLADGVIARLAERAAELGVTVRADLADDVVALGIPKLADQIVYNLCDNALRYNRPNGSVLVTCARDEAGRPFVRVEDTGIGIAPENHDKVFNRFFRVDAGRSRATGGTGLGLAIVKHAARCQGAECAIESALGEGTAITVTFCPTDVKTGETLAPEGGTA